MVYVLQARLNVKKYYVTDLQGSLSRNLQDSMLFCNEFVAETYAGPIECLLEKQTGFIATIHILKVASSSIIPRTVIECVSSP